MVVKVRAPQLDRQNLSDQIIEHIVSWIREGKLKTGDKLPTELELTKQFGVGRSSVREALGALELIGVITSKPGKGAVITVSQDLFLAKPLSWGMMVTPRNINELVDAREVLEIAAARFAAKKATPEDINKLRNWYETIKSLEKKKNRKKRIQASLDFHLALVQASHNSILVRFYSELQRILRMWIEQTTMREPRDPTIEQHDKIIKSIEAHDVEAAESAMKEHIKWSSANLDHALMSRQIGLSKRER